MPSGSPSGSPAALGAAALYNRAQARRAELDNPPVGRFLELDGAGLHYLDEGPAGTGTTGQGGGSPVVLLHGNTVTLDDWVVSGVFDLVSASRRVVAFDRPGFGYSAIGRAVDPDPGSPGDLASKGMSPTWPRAPGRSRAFLGNAGGARVGAPGPRGGSWFVRSPVTTIPARGLTQHGRRSPPSPSWATSSTTPSRHCSRV